MTLTDVLNFLTSEKTVIVGSITCLCESVVIIVNTYRRLKSHEQDNKITPSSYEPSPKLKTSEILLWSLNPLNLFRKIN